METPWGALADLDPNDRTLALSILSSDKHQLIEGLVVENTFDQILRPLEAGLGSRLAKLDIETVMVDTSRSPDRWLALVLARNPTKTVGLGRYLCALLRVAQVYVVELEGGTFVAREWTGRRRSHASWALHDLLEGISGRKPTLPKVDLRVRDADRQRTAFWGYLSSTYTGARLWNEVVLSRLFINIGVQPFFRGVWNLDRICLFDDELWLLEVKHKFPFGGSRLMFGINDGELGLMNLTGEAGIRTLYTIIVKPQWSKDIGSMYLHSDLQMRERAAIIGMAPGQEDIRKIAGGASGTSPAHTSITGRGELKYKSIPARDFSYMGAFSDGADALSANLGRLLSGMICPAVSDELLRRLSTGSKDNAIPK